MKSTETDAGKLPLLRTKVWLAAGIFGSPIESSTDENVEPVMLPVNVSASASNAPPAGNPENVMVSHRAADGK